MSQIDSEWAYMGCALLDPTVLTRFPLDLNRLVNHPIKAVLKAMQDGLTDPVVLHERGFLTTAQAADAFNMVASPEHAIQFARIINENWRVREFKAVAAEIQAFGIDGLNVISKRLQSLMDDAAPQAAMSHEQMIQFLIQDLDSPQQADFDIGLRRTSECFAGLNRKELILVYGETSHGKTATMLSFVRGPLMGGCRVLIADYELGTPMTYRRLASMISNAKLNEVAERRQSVSEKEAYLKGLETLSKLNLNVMASPNMAALEVEIEKFKPDIVVVDYIQLAADVEKNKNENLSQTITSIMAKLKRLCLTKDCCVIVGSQVVKDVGKGRARLPDVKESGAIANSATKAICAYWPSKKGRPVHSEMYVLGIDKNTNGPTAEIVVRIQAHCGRLEDPPEGMFTQAEKEMAVQGG